MWKWSGLLGHSTVPPFHYHDLSFVVNWENLFLLSRQTILCYFNSFIMLKFQLSCHSVCFFYYSLNWQKRVLLCFVLFSSLCKCCKKENVNIWFKKKKVGFQLGLSEGFCAHKYSEQNNCCFVLCSWERTAWSNRAGLFQRLSVDCYFDVKTVLFCLIE